MNICTQKKGNFIKLNTTSACVLSFHFVEIYRTQA